MQFILRFTHDKLNHMANILHIYNEYVTISSIDCELFAMTI